MGLKAGVPDIAMLYPSSIGDIHYCGLFIELKRPEVKDVKAGKLSIKQLSMLEKLKERGYFTALCYGWIDAANITKEYLK